MDITLFGATSFVGRLTAGYLARHYPNAQVALAGRNREKLAALRDELGVSWEIALADAHDEPSLRALAENTKVIISTVGPYGRFGATLIGVCAQTGTHYVDLCGEALFIREMIDAHHETARATGAHIVCSCGFDSVPSDMGVFRLFEKSGGEGFERITMVVEKLRGGLSGGTIDSMREAGAQARSSKEAGRLLHNPYTLCPDPKAEPYLPGLERDLIEERFEAGPARGWLGPFFMAPFNTRVVRRSNSLRGHAYGERLVYREGIATGRGLLGRLKARVLLVATAVGFTAIQVPRLRRPLSVVVPEPGEGPGEKLLENGYFRVSHVGETASGRVVTATLAAHGDPGYRTTAMMLSEAALTLAFDLTGEAEGGILTPATGLGAPYLARLRAGGMTIS